MKDVWRGEEGGRVNTVENTRLGRMLLSLSCFVNRWRCNCTLDLRCSSHRSPATVKNGNLKKQEKGGCQASRLRVDVTTLSPVSLNCLGGTVQIKSYPWFLLFDQVWKWEREIDSLFPVFQMIAAEQFKGFLTHGKTMKNLRKMFFM